MSCRIRSSGNHSLSMYGSSCGSPCLILHACRECHNTFPSPSSTSSQGQAGEESCSHVCVCVSQFRHSCSIHMHASADSIRLHARDTRLLSLLMRRAVYVYSCTNTCASPREARRYVGLHHLHCSTRLSRQINLN